LFCIQFEAHSQSFPHELVTTAEISVEKPCQMVRY
jgi:hypothetical protein